MRPAGSAEVCSSPAKSPTDSACLSQAESTDTDEGQTEEGDAEPEDAGSGQGSQQSAASREDYQR